MLFAGSVRNVGQRGFALVVTLSLMILLTIIAVALLGLSAVSLRSSAADGARRQAQANARLALMLAIGELQKNLGKDTAVTASSDLTLQAGSGERHLTGVWDSWPVPVSGNPDYTSEKDKRFRGWLVSDSDPTKVKSMDYPQSGPTNPVILVREDPATNTGKVAAGLVKVGTGGDYAWHVADESTKARIDLLRDPDHGSSNYRRRALLTGHRPGLRELEPVLGFDFSKLPNDDTAPVYDQELPKTGKLATLGQVDLLQAGKLPPSLRHELTVGTLGVLSDAGNGGLKKDLSTAFGVAAGLPAELAGKRVYQSTHGTSGISDPYWSNLSGYHNLYTRKGNLADVQLPEFASTGGRDGTSTAPPPVPREYTLSPVIQRVDLNFSVFTIRIPGSKTKPEQLNLYLCYNPIVVLHNPYNSRVTFERFTLVIEELPLLFEFSGPNLGHFRADGVWRPSPPTPLPLGNTCGSPHSAIRLEFPDRNLTPTQQAVMQRLEPGQTRFFAPTLSSTATIDTSHFNGSLGQFDKHVERTLADAADPPPASGSNTDGALSVPIPCGREYLQARGGVYCRNLHGFPDGVAAFKPPPLGQAINDTYPESFSVKVTAAHRTDWKIAGFVKIKKPDGGFQVIPSGTMRFDYGNPDAFKKLLGGANEILMPSTKAWNVCIGSRTSFQLKNAAPPYTFATLSLVARTANGGVYETGGRMPSSAALNRFFDGRLAGKPFLHENAALASFTHNLATEKVGMHSHEINLVPRPGHLEDVMEVDSQGHTPALTGNRVVTGIKTGVLFELPLGPMLNLAGFRRSNAFASSYLPRSVQPLANSWVPPTMNTTEAVTTGVAAYDLLDHSYLANAALYDGYYFSTVATPPGASGAASSARGVFETFAKGMNPLPSQSMQAYNPGSGSLDDGLLRLFEGDGKPKDGAWKEMASWQMVKGPFNVNSTSLIAWKAMLASMANTPVPVRWARGYGTDIVQADKPLVTALSMHLAGIADPGASVNPATVHDEQTQHWNGFRTLSPTQLDELAKKIVEEVRSRGPFLSMAEFVNRRLGSNSELTRVGALQAAIDKAKFNDGMFPDIPPVTASDLPTDVYGYKTPEAATGNPADGAPGMVTQGDLLNLLDPRATVRGDTFVIRTVGRALDKAGKVTAIAYAEAVVQRVPDYVDPADMAHVAANSQANKDFGRRFIITGFRWLTPSEIQ